MAKLTWLGEGVHSPSQIEWNGITFPLNEPVEVDDPVMIRKASANPRFKVEDDPPEPKPELHPTEEDEDEEEDDEEEDKPTKRAAPRAAPKVKPKPHVSRWRR